MKRPLSLNLTKTFVVFRQLLINWLVRNNWYIFCIAYFCHSAYEKSKQIKNSPASASSAVYTKKLIVYLFCALKLKKFSKHIRSLFDNVPNERIRFRLVELSYLDQLLQQSSVSSSESELSQKSKRRKKLNLKIPSSLWSEKVWQNCKVFRLDII